MPGCELDSSPHELRGKPFGFALRRAGRTFFRRRRLRRRAWHVAGGACSRDLPLMPRDLTVAAGYAVELGTWLEVLASPRVGDAT